MTGKQKRVLGLTSLASLMGQMAQARQADLLREAEEYRRAGPTARPRVLSRVIARITALRHRDPPDPRACRRAVDTRPNATGEDQPPARALG